MPESLRSVPSSARLLTPSGARVVLPYIGASGGPTFEPMTAAGAGVDEIKSFRDELAIPAIAAAGEATVTVQNRAITTEPMEAAGAASRTIIARGPIPIPGMTAAGAQVRTSFAAGAVSMTALQHRGWGGSTGAAAPTVHRFTGEGISLAVPFVDQGSAQRVWSAQGGASLATIGLSAAAKRASKGVGAIELAHPTFVLGQPQPAAGAPSLPALAIAGVAERWVILEPALSPAPMRLAAVAKRAVSATAALGLTSMAAGAVASVPGTHTATGDIETAAWTITAGTRVDTTAQASGDLETAAMGLLGAGAVLRVPEAAADIDHAAMALSAVASRTITAEASVAFAAMAPEGAAVYRVRGAVEHAAMTVSASAARIITAAGDIETRRMTAAGEAERTPPSWADGGTELEGMELAGVVSRTVGAAGELALALPTFVYAGSRVIEAAAAIEHPALRHLSRADGAIRTDYQLFRVVRIKQQPTQTTKTIILEPVRRPINR